MYKLLVFLINFQIIINNIGLVEEKKMMVARQFRCSSTSGSPPNEIVESMKYKSMFGDGRQGSSSSSSGVKIYNGDHIDHDQDKWVRSKVPKFNKDNEVQAVSSETMAMIRKARVSVRARTESNMVTHP